MKPGDDKWKKNGVSPDEKSWLNRRRFMAYMTGWGAIGLHGFQSSCNAEKKQEAESDDAVRHDPDDGVKASQRPPSVVAKLERPDTIAAGAPVSKDLATKLMSDLLGSLEPGKDAVHFLKSRFGAGRKVGIKPNCLAGRGLSTRPELVLALVDLLVQAGTSPGDITIFERTGRELRRAGFKIQTKQGGSEPRIMGNDSRGAGFEEAPVCFESIGSCFCNVLTRDIDDLINFGVLKDHDLAGISIGLKNLYGLIHNPNKYHDHGCAPYVAHVAASPPVRRKLRLTLCDGLVAQYHGGPALKKAYTWNAGILLASKDPVSLDAVGLGIIEKKRLEAGMKTLSESGRYPAWLEEAFRSGLGEHQMDRIEVRSL